MNMLQHRLTASARVLALSLGLLAAVMTPSPARTQDAPPTTPQQFLAAAPQGFGSRQNSITWSAAWFKGKLYVGTGRAINCVQIATQVYYKVPFVRYPPVEPDIECTPDMYDLPLQAEIWRWTPETGAWDRVFQSPNDIPIPGHPGKFIARDIGFRGMTVFTEADGTEVLYVGGLTGRSFIPGLPAPRILRTVDGASFEALPQSPGTFLHAIEAVGFRGMVEYQGRLYALASDGLAGQGFIVEAADPRGGNDNFRRITWAPVDPVFYELRVFNGLLYVGTASREQEDTGFEVYKTDTAGSLPYVLTPVVIDGGDRRQNPSKTIVSMYEFNDQLYVGSDRPAELLRINPDDSWDLVVGAPRWTTPAGPKQPLSGMDAGFDWNYNIHIWRMASYGGRLYAGTMDNSTIYRDIPGLRELVAGKMGFDLYTTSDGERWTMITQTGLGDKFNVGVRQLVPTTEGLFLGAENHYYGTNIWRSGTPLQLPYRTLVPIAVAGSRRTVALGEPEQAAAPVFAAVSPQPSSPARLESVAGADSALLVWEPVAAAARYQIFRSDWAFSRELKAVDPAGDGMISGPWKHVATTVEPLWVDRAAHAGRFAHYYVVAEDSRGLLSQPSNLARFPSLAATPTIAGLRSRLAEWSNDTTPGHQTSSLDTALAAAQRLLAAREYAAVAQQLERLQGSAAQQSSLQPWRSAELESSLARLALRITLLEHGLVSPSAVLGDSSGPVQ